MQPVTFSPQSPKDHSNDTITITLQRIARYIFIASTAVLPIFFIPNLSAPLEHSKIAFLLAGTLLAVIFFALATLRTGRLRLQLTLPIAALWGLVIAAGLSGLLSGSQYTSFISYNIGTQTAVFLGIFALVVTASQFLLSEKTEIIYLYLLLFAAGVLVAIYHLLRLFFGVEFLSFGLDLDTTFSILGGWNDLAVFYGLLLLLSLVALEQLPLPRIGKFIFAGVSVVALILLAIVQFTAIWVLVGLSSLVILMYSLMRHRLEPDYRDASSFSIIIAAITVILSFVFVIGGDQLGSQISNATNINYLEVRPSMSATAEIARHVYADDIFLGTGPNRFSDAWRMYKDQSINETMFWNTDFTTGNGYLSTLFVTTGLLGSIFLLLFIGLFFWNQYKALFAPTQQDHFWYFIANSATIGTSYLLIILFIYAPSATILLLTALFIGIALVAASVLRQSPVFWFDSNQNKRKTVVLIIGVLLVLLLSVTSMYAAQAHYGAHVSYNQALLASSSADDRHARLIGVIERAGSDRYARILAQSALGEVNAILALSEPTAEDSDRFVENFQIAQEAASEAVRRDQQRAINWATLAAVYSAYASPETPEAGARARENLDRALALEPLNPEFRVLAGEIAVREGDLERAREHFNEALLYKSNYIVALNGLAEIDIATGNISNARQGVRRILQLQPNNPGRHYQLAILYLAEEMVDPAVTSLQRAISLDPNFANARYILALQYIERNQTDSAIEQLQVVAQLNPNNQEVAELLTQLEAGEAVSIPNDPITTGSDSITVPGEEQPTMNSSIPETNLLQPVNTGSNQQDPQTTNDEPVLEAPPATNRNTDEILDSDENGA